MTQRTRILEDTAAGGYSPRRLIGLDKVVNNSGIAKMAGVGRSCVSNWIARYADFPPPLDMPNVVGHHALYDLAAVKRWAALHDIPLTE